MNIRKISFFMVLIALNTCHNTYSISDLKQQQLNNLLFSSPEFKNQASCCPFMNQALPGSIPTSIPISNQFFDPNLRALSGPQQLGKRFLKAQTFKDQSQFCSIMSQAVQQYRGNKKAFAEFLDARDGYGCTSLLRAAALTDMDQIIFILHKLQEYYKDDGKDVLDVFSFLNAECLQGHTAFYLLVQNGTKDDVKQMLYHVLKLIGLHKELFLRFLTTSTYDNQWTPLHWLAYEGDIRILKAVIVIAEKVFGLKSPEFDSFINAKDKDGMTPLSNTYFNIRQKKLLLEHGATIFHNVKKDVQEARQLGLELIEAIREDKLNTVHKIMFRAQNKYKEQPKLFLEFITVRSHGGWDPLMHATSLSYEYTAFLLNVIAKFFANDEESFYTIMRSVAEDGRGALIISILRRNFRTAQLLIDKIMNFTPSKFFLYILLSMRVYVKGFSPLTAAVNFSSDRDEFYELIKSLLEAIEKSFKKDSRAMNLFVNIIDLDGFPPLAYATSPKITELLEDYGAQLEPLPFSCRLI